MGATMETVLHANSKGIRILRQDYKTRSSVKVIDESTGKRHCIRTYRFALVKGAPVIPYCSWANLDCCGGWSYDENYLETAVQYGKKLYAGISQYISTSVDKERKKFECMWKTLPPDIMAGYESCTRTPLFIHTYICRKGRIADYIDLDLVFQLYYDYGHNFSDVQKQEIIRNCSCEICSYATENPPFNYADASSISQLVTTGLLLGYPIESTVSILEGY